MSRWYREIAFELALGAALLLVTCLYIHAQLELRTAYNELRSIYDARALGDNSPDDLRAFREEHCHRRPVRAAVPEVSP